MENNGDEIKLEKNEGNSKNKCNRSLLNPTYSKSLIAKGHRCIFKSLCYILVAGFSLILIALAMMWYVNWFSKPPAFTVDFLEVEKCPGCVGQSLCPKFYSGEISFARFPKPNISSVFGNEGIIGFHQNEKRILIRRFGSPADFDQIDESVCKRGPREGASKASPSVIAQLPCLPHLAIWQWLATDTDHHDHRRAAGGGGSTEMSLSRQFILASNLVSDGYSPATRCISDRLFDLLQNRFLERTSFGAKTRWLRFDELMFLFNLAVDPQPIIVQSFPQSNNWPFPKYIGACGRWTVEEYYGLPLSKFRQSPVWLRLRILRSILDLPARLERAPHLSPLDNRSNDDSFGYAIYLGNFDLDSLLVVDPLTYEVAIYNLKHALVVDTQTLIDFGLVSSNQDDHIVANASSIYLHDGLLNHNCLGNTSIVGGGHTPPCLTAHHADDLCSHIKSDHNYWAICSALYFDRPKRGFLSDLMPDSAMRLLQDCVYEGATANRRRVFSQLIWSVDQLIGRHSIPFGW